MSRPTDALTRKLTEAFVLDKSDEFAVQRECWFDVYTGMFTVWWIERHCCLYEGDNAGQPLILKGRHDVPDDQWLPVPPLFYDPDFDYNRKWKPGENVLPETRRWLHERVESELSACRSGEPCDWQWHTTVRIFGWQKWSDHWGRAIRRFRRASVFIPKKNKKSPTLAAYGTYLWAGDGEQGQKVFFGAKDGKQAKEISGAHAWEMVKASPELSGVTHFNRTETKMTHRPSKSIVKPLSSGNARHQDAKEGINGSVLIDETHVIDYDFVAIIERAGISRSEPLQIEVSTAGNNRDGYGFDQFLYAQDVRDGEVEDLGFYGGSVYAAPQRLTASQLDDDPLKWGIIANPAWGHTINPDEFLEDYERSKARGMEELARFKMYRLNLWMNSASPWINALEWEACRDDDLRLEDYEGQQAVAALDMSRKRDTTSLTLCFRHLTEPDHYVGFAWFWIPQVTAEDQSHLAAYRRWHADGWLRYCEGNTIDYSQLWYEFKEILSPFDVLRMNYDQTYADQFTQELEQGRRDNEGVVTDRGLGIARYHFPQQLMRFAPVVSTFDEMIANGRFHHNGNPVLTWQAGNCTVWEDVNANKRPIKPKTGDYRTIDGVVSLLMSFDGLMEEFSPDRLSVYEAEDRLFHTL